MITEKKLRERIYALGLPVSFTYNQLVPLLSPRRMAINARLTIHVRRANRIQNQEPPMTASSLYTQLNRTLDYISWRLRPSPYSSHRLPPTIGIRVGQHRLKNSLRLTYSTFRKIQVRP